MIQILKVLHKEQIQSMTALHLQTPYGIRVSVFADATDADFSLWIFHASIFSYQQSNPCYQQPLYVHEYPIPRFQCAEH